MRVLAIETSSVRGSVALVEDDQIVASAHHEEASRHGERLLPLIDEALAASGWSRSSIDRLGVGVGPGSFTGLRVGIALATGLALGLGVPLVGVGSLRAIAAGHPSSDPRLRLVVRDARRSEHFVAAYDADGAELHAPEACPQARTPERLRQLAGERPFVVLGLQLPGLPCASSEWTEFPDARAIGRLARRLAPEGHPPRPHYVRGPNAVRPHLPPSPLLQPRS